MGPHYDVPLHIALSMLLAAANIGGRAAEAPQLPASTSTLPSVPDRGRLGEQDWLRAIAQGAGGDSLAPYRQRIFRTSAGRYYVPTPTERAAILALRDDPAVHGAVERFLARPPPRAAASRSVVAGPSQSEAAVHPLFKGPVDDASGGASSADQGLEKLAIAGWRTVVVSPP